MMYFKSQYKYIPAVIACCNYRYGTSNNVKGINQVNSSVFVYDVSLEYAKFKLINFSSGNEDTGHLNYIAIGKI